MLKHYEWASQMGIVTLTGSAAGTIALTFPYSPDFVVKVKSIPGHHWHPDDKYWSFPHTDGIIEKILKAFEGEEIHVDPSLKSFVPNKKSISTVTARGATVPQSRPYTRALDSMSLEDLRREMVSRKYS